MSLLRMFSAVSEITGDGEVDEEKNKALVEAFKAELNDDTLKIEVEPLKNEAVPAVLTLSEESRRMQEMYKSYGQQFAGMANMFHDEFTLVLNSNNSLIKQLDTLDDDTKKLVIDHVYDLAKLSHSPLDSERMSAFVARSNELLSRLYK